MGWIDNDNFEFWVPAQIIDVEKSDSSKDSKGPKKRWIQGVASTSSRDLQGEIVDQQGIDFSYFLKHGYLNNDHRPGFKNKVGQPTEARITKNGLWIKGFLFDKHIISDEIWDLMNSLEASQSDRRLGFSIQGKVKERAGSRIKKCWILDVAVTPAPVNTTTWAEIAKSLSAHKWELTKKSVDGGEQDALCPQVPLHGAGSVLGVESSEGDKEEDKASRAVKKNLTLSEAVSFLEANHGLPRGTAENVAKAIFTTIPGERYD